MPSKVLESPLKEEKLLEWVQFREGFIGILPCAGLEIHITRQNGGDYVGSYRIRFGMVEASNHYWNLEIAKIDAVKLAKNVLLDCLVSLPEV